MADYKIEICSAVGCSPVETVEFEEQIQDEAKAKSYKMLLDKAEQFSDGEYTGTLYRKSPLLGWQKVSAPVISCKVENGNVDLTVKRVRYGRENSIIDELNNICCALQQEKMQVLANLNVAVSPNNVDAIFIKAKQLLKTLFADYRPDYLDADLLFDMESKIDDVRNNIQSSYAAYGHSNQIDNYTTSLATEIGDAQELLLIFLIKLQP